MLLRYLKTLTLIFKFLCAPKQLFCGTLLRPPPLPTANEIFFNLNNSISYYSDIDLKLSKIFLFVSIDSDLLARLGDKRKLLVTKFSKSQI